MLGIVIFTIIIGVAITQLRQETARPIIHNEKAVSVDIKTLKLKDLKYNDNFKPGADHQYCYDIDFKQYIQDDEIKEMVQSVTLAYSNIKTTRSQASSIIYVNALHIYDKLRYYDRNMLGGAIRTINQFITIRGAEISRHDFCTGVQFTEATNDRERLEQFSDIIPEFIATLEATLKEGIKYSQKMKLKHDQRRVREKTLEDSKEEIERCLHAITDSDLVTGHKIEFENKGYTITLDVPGIEHVDRSISKYAGSMTNVSVHINSASLRITKPLLKIMPLLDVFQDRMLNIDPQILMWITIKDDNIYIMVSLKDDKRKSRLE